MTQAGGPPPAESRAVFDLLSRMLSTLPASAAREDAAEALKKLEAEAQKGALADDGRIQRCLNILRNTAPAVHQAACAALGRPTQA